MFHYCPQHKEQVMEMNHMGLYTCPICMVNANSWAKLQREKTPLQPQVKVSRYE